MSESAPKYEIKLSEISDDPTDISTQVMLCYAEGLASVPFLSSASDGELTARAERFFKGMNLFLEEYARQSETSKVATVDEAAVARRAALAAAEAEEPTV